MFALVDCNSCYASCEQIFRPDLRGKPVVVLTNNDGCIVARSKEAKALDVPDLIPFFKIKDFLEKHQVHVFSSNYELYGDVSRRIMSLLRNYARDIEIYSIDEAFLDVSGCEDLYQHGHKIKQACWQQQRMPVSVGIAPSKTLAKMANHIAKKSQKLNGVCVIENPELWAKVFQKISVRKVWGIGAQITKRLENHGVHTVDDLRKQAPKTLRKKFGVSVERTIRELNGEKCILLEATPAPRKEIICSRSFSKKVTEKNAVRESLANYAIRAGEKLRQQHSLVTQVEIMLQTSRFNPPFYFPNAGTRLLYPTNDDRIIIKTALDLLDTIFKPDLAYAKAGIVLRELVADDFLQHDLFTLGQSTGAFKTMESLDKINLRYGRGSIFFGRQGIKREWSMARDFKSPAYTTRFQDIPVVKINQENCH